MMAMKNNYTIKLQESNPILYKTLFLVFFINFANFLSAQTTSVYIPSTNPMSWTCPAGVTTIQVEAIGGGAGARTATSSNGHVTGGGGGGSYARRNAITVVPGTVYSVMSIGAGGTAGVAGGTTSATINGVTISAPGGSTGVVSVASTNVAGGVGGVAGTGDVIYVGGNGGSGWGSSSAGGSGSGGGGGSAAGSGGTSNAGQNATGTTSPGAGGNTVANYGGAGGAGGNNADGSSATANYGGGGGGAGHKGKTGGSGQYGAIIITYNCPSNTVANAGSNQTLAACITSTTLAGNTPTYGTGTWTVMLGAATITTPTSATSTVTGLSLGATATLRWTISNGYCGSTTSDITITTVAPANPSNPTSNSPQCNPPGVTLTRVGTVPANELWYWQTVSLGTSTANSSATYTATASGTYYIRAYNTISGCWSSGQGSLAVTISPSISTLATVPSPTTAATGICYAGVGAVTSVSWTAAAGATSYDVYFGAGSVPGTVTANVATTSYTTGTLSASTTYYWKVVPRNSTCPSTGTALTWTFTTASSSCLSYCTPSATNVYAVSSVSFNTINNAVVGTAGYENFSTISTTLTAGYTYTISVTVVGANGNPAYTSVWFDWNNNGTFDASEENQLGTYSTGTYAFTTTITVPLTATVGSSRMRVINRVLTGYPTACGPITYGQYEDYSFNIVSPPACTTPTAQPTALVLSPSGTSLAGSFTAASPAPNNYLVVINTTGTTPTPVNGITYTIGGAITGGTVVDIDSNTSFVATGLTVSTTYYIFVFSYNSICTGLSQYYSTLPLTDSTTTLATSYCIPTGSLDCTTNGDYIANVTFNTINNSSTCSPGGYINYPAAGGQTTTLIRGNSFNLSIGTGPGNKKHGAAVWIDFNQNGSFADAGEYFLIGNNVIANSTNTIAIAIPAGATLGQTRMRVRYAQKITMTSAMSCTMAGNYGETEDYTVTIANSIVCAAPTTQPTSLILSSTGTTISGSFTAANPVPNNYLVVINTTGTTPTPSNGTTYTVGGAIIGGTVVDIDSNTIFTATSLSTLTTYYFFVFSYNSICTGGPTYNLVSPLIGNVATITSNYCTPSVSNTREDDDYLTEVSFVGTLNDVSNYSTYSSSPLGYQDFTGLANLARQSQGNGINVSVQALYSSFMKAWVDWNKDGSFDNTTEIVYNSGTISTGSTTFGFIIPPSQALGNYRIRIRIDLNGGSGSTTFTSCGNLVNGGETEDYLFTVVASCDATIASITEGRTCGPGTVDLDVTSSVVVPAVSQFRWYTTPTGSTLVGSTSSGTWTTPSINTTTTYYVTAYNGCESLTRTEIQAIVSPVPTLDYLPVSPQSCGENAGVQISATGDQEEIYLINEEFNSGLGTFTNTNITSSVRNSDTQWQNRTSTYIPTAISGTNTWYPAVSSGINGDGFAMATSDFANAIPYVHNQIASSAVSTVNFTSLTLNLRMFYSRYFLDLAYPAEEYVTIDVSTDNGTSWIEIKRFTEDVGIGTKFENLTYDLSSYVGVSQFKVRVKYYNNNWCDGIAIDDVELFGYRPNVNLNWTTTIPAFTDAACTIAYDPLTTASLIYVQPTLAQLELSSFNFTVNAVLDNGCVTSKVITVTNNSKIWQGGTPGSETKWETDANWKPNGIPTATNCIIIPDTTYDPIISGSSYDAFGKNIQIKSGAVLTVNSDNNITITDEVTVKTGGLFDIKNSASLLQTNDAAINSGSIKMTRTSRAMTRFAYVYAGSPIAENAFSQIPTEFDLKYRWTSGTMNGAWATLSALTSGEGFIARVKNIAPFTAGTGTIDFVWTGTPKNGVVNVTVDSYDSSSLVAGNTVLLANPYPSAIDATSFLTNSSNTELGGTLFFWTSVTLYNGGPYSITDYGSWNLSGGVGTSPASDPTNTSLKPNGKIVAGQGFFAQAFADGQITFNDNMRVPDFNSQFFKDGNIAQSVSKNRIWLNLYGETSFRQTLVGYMDNATNGFDKFYDGDSFTSNEINIYSLLGDRKLVIQAKALPFDENDVVPLGYRITNGGAYSINIDELDGIFSGHQSVYLRDKLLGIDHDIKETPYSFSTAAGTFDNRFELVYVSNALGTTNPREINTSAMISNHVIKVESSEIIKEISIYDITGKLINSYSLTESKKQFSDAFNYPNGIYIAKIRLDNDAVVTKKLIN
jgi:hypothetical protein